VVVVRGGVRRGERKRGGEERGFPVVPCLLPLV